ncbi:MAG: DUF1847 domain-containing protein [Clostridiaceae bacterium]|nr:DUF1847 domain-containing protein [Clostridiaceae bacterium]
MVNCTGCKISSCYKGEECIRGQDLSSYEAPSREEYKKGDNKRIFEAASHIEGEHYMEWTRLEEIIGFAEEMGYTKIGISHCVGLTTEAKHLKEVLDEKFNVEAVCCKFSAIDKKDFNLTQIDCKRYEAICNPIGQAIVLNDLKTDLNIIVGLCIGHDMLFTKYSEAPVTTFIVKDRVTGHNPAATLYSSYYHNKLKK